MSRLVVSTYTALWRTELDALCRELGDASYGTVEVLAAPPHVDLEDLAGSTRRLSQALADAGIHVNSVVPSGVDVNLASTQRGVRDWSVGQFVAAVRLAAAVGAPQAVVHPGRRHPLRPPPLELLHDWVVDGLSQVLAVADDEGVELLVENVPTGLLDTAEELGALADRLHGRIRLCFDVANGFMVEDVVAGLRTSAPRLGLVHLSDTTRERWLHDPLGAGSVPWGDVVRALDDISYAGPVVLETLHGGSASVGFAADTAVLAAAGWRDGAEPRASVPT